MTDDDQQHDDIDEVQEGVQQEPWDADAPEVGELPEDVPEDER